MRQRVTEIYISNILARLPKFRNIKDTLFLAKSYYFFGTRSMGGITCLFKIFRCSRHLRLVKNPYKFQDCGACHSLQSLVQRELSSRREYHLTN